MRLPTKDSRPSGGVTLSLPAGDQIHNVKIIGVNESLLIRIEDCDVLDLLPLSSGAATRIIDWLRVPPMEKGAWMAFLTRPSSMEQALGLAKEKFGVAV